MYIHVNVCKYMATQSVHCLSLGSQVNIKYSKQSLSQLQISNKQNSSKAEQEEC